MWRHGAPTCASRKSTSLNNHDDEKHTAKAPVSVPRLVMTNASRTFPNTDLSCASFALSMTLLYAPGITLGLTPCFRYYSCSLHHTYMCNHYGLFAARSLFLAPGWSKCVWMIDTRLSTLPLWILISLVYFELVLGEVEMNSPQMEVYLYLPASSLLTNIFPPNYFIYPI